MRRVDERRDRQAVCLRARVYRDMQKRWPANIELVCSDATRSYAGAAARVWYGVGAGQRRLQLANIRELWLRGLAEQTTVNNSLQATVKLYRCMWTLRSSTFASPRCECVCDLALAAHARMAPWVFHETAQAPPRFTQSHATHMEGCAHVQTLVVGSAGSQTCRTSFLTLDMHVWLSLCWWRFYRRLVGRYPTHHSRLRPSHTWCA